jgi:hypothetical protein
LFEDFFVPKIAHLTREHRESCRGRSYCRALLLDPDRIADIDAAGAMAMARHHTALVEFLARTKYYNNPLQFAADMEEDEASLHRLANSAN